MDWVVGIVLISSGIIIGIIIVMFRWEAQIQLDRNKDIIKHHKERRKH